MTTPSAYALARLEEIAECGHECEILAISPQGSLFVKIGDEQHALIGHAEDVTRAQLAEQVFFRCSERSPVGDRVH